MVVFNICGVKLPKIAQQLKFFKRLKPGANAKNSIQVHSRFAEFWWAEVGLTLIILTYLTKPITEVLRRPMSPKLWFLTVETGVCIKAQP